MSDTARSSLLERIEEKAREATPLWQWLVSIVPVFLPIQLGYFYAAHLERVSGILRYDDIMTILYAQAAGAMGLLFLGILDMSKGYSRKLLRRPDPKAQPPGPFRLGGGLIGVIYRPWWGIPLMAVSFPIFMRLVESEELVIYPDEIFWQSRALFGWFFVAVLGTLGAVTFVGLIVRQRLRERGRPV